MTEKQNVKDNPVKVLLLEDNPDDVLLCVNKLKSSGIEPVVEVAGNCRQFSERIQAGVYDAVIADYGLPDGTALDALRDMREAGRVLPFILFTGTLEDEVAVECIREGATDYVLKGRPERLPFALLRALREQVLRCERDQAERQLRQSEKDYRSIIEGAPYGVYRADHAGSILMANPALVAMLGYDSEADLFQLSMERDVYWEPQKRKEILSNLQPNFNHHEVQWKRKDGKQITVYLSGRTLPGGPDSNEIFEVFVENITERLALERQFLQAQKMEAVGRLAGGIAHDFNNLLMIIRGCSEILESHKDQPEKISNYVRQIYAATSTATAVVQQLLAFSRKQVPERRILDLDAVLKDLLRMMPRLLGEDVEVVLSAGEGRHHLNADLSNVQQIIMNLAVNARDAMPHGGTLTIATGSVELDELSSQGSDGTAVPGHYVSLRVTDTGTGMDDDTLAHLFEPFFTTKERGKGTGLGLSTVYGIVKQNGGWISVDSTVGQGTTFKIYFPAVELHEVPEQSKDLTPSPGGTETILLVEDEAALREITCEYLQSKGYIVLAAANGDKALDLCKTYDKPIHILLTDVIMPGISGPELARTAVHLRPSLRTIYVSGYTDRVIDPSNLGANGVFLQKPYSLADLGKKIRQACTSN